MIRYIMIGYINDPVPLMRALQQLSAQRRQRDLASINFHLRRNLGSRHLLQPEPADMQVAMCLDRKQRRRAQRIIGTGIRIGIQDAVPRTLGRMRREPFGEISGRKLVGHEIELKHTSWNDTRDDGRSGGWGGAPRRRMPGGCNFAATMTASRPRTNLRPAYRVPPG